MSLPTAPPLAPSLTPVEMTHPVREQLKGEASPQVMLMETRYGLHTGFPVVSGVWGSFLHKWEHTVCSPGL